MLSSAPWAHESQCFVVTVESQRQSALNFGTFKTDSCLPCREKWGGKGAVVPRVCVFGVSQAVAQHNSKSHRIARYNATKSSKHTIA